MAKAKRQGGKGFGKPPKPPSLDKSIDIEGVANGKLILVANVIKDDSAGVGDIFTLLTYDDLVGGLTDLKAVVDIASNPSTIYLARRRQLENGEGLLTLTPRGYRQRWGLADESDGEIIFNWWTLAELKITQERSYIFGGTRILARLSEPLVHYSNNRFPVICHAVPFITEDQETGFAHLMFTVSCNPEQAVEQRKVHFLEQETKLLTDLFIPNAENAVVDIRKLRDYCLNPEHDEGKHKARLFLSILGMTAEDAEDLRSILLEVVKTHEAKLGRRDEFGQRYTLDFIIEGQDRSATIRSGWIIEEGSNIPRLTTCYPL